MLMENEQVKGEVFDPTERIKLYVLEVKDTPKGPKILVSRTHPELVKRLFESEVIEVKDGTVEIKSISKLKISEKVKQEINTFLNTYYDRYTGLYLKSKNFLKKLMG